MSSGEVRRVSRQDIQLVQNLIERCLQLYMNQKEVVETLLVQAKIEPGFTELVWQKLEEENREFFKAYHVRLTVKNQIMIFNKLLEKQVELMQKMCPPGVTSVPNSNGSHSSKRPVPASRLQNMTHPADISGALMNGGSSVHGNMRSSGDLLVHSGRMDASPNILPTHNLHMGVAQGVNGDLIKSEPSYADSSPFTFGGDGNVMEMRPTVCDASVASFGSVENNSQALNGLHDTDNPSYGFLGQIPRSFSLSDLTADFSQSSEILESYSRSPFLATDVDEFLDSPGRECLGENKRLDTISEGLSYEEFSSD